MMDMYSFNPKTDRWFFSEEEGVVILEREVRKMCDYQKPPLGLLPSKIYRQQRALDIVWAIERYIKADKLVPQEWIRELEDIVV